MFDFVKGGMKQKDEKKARGLAVPKSREGSRYLLEG